MAAPSGVIVAWPSTVGSIPTGWSRVAALDSSYPRGASTAGGTGGSNTHNHTADEHNHQGTDHVHGINASSASTGSTTHQIGAGQTTNDAVNHTHTGEETDDTGSEPTSATVGSLTTSSANNEPNRYTVIWIKSAGTHDVAQNSIMYWNNSSAPPNHAICTGASGTPDLRNYFLRGAAAGSGGGTRTAASSHNHTNDHTHTDSHNHAEPSLIGTASLAAGDLAANGTVIISTTVHNHAIGGDGVTSTDSADMDVSEDTTSNTTPEPPWHKLHHIQKTSSSSSIPTGLIVLWDGLAGSIPANWQACDGTNGTPDLNGNLFIKGANTSAELGDTGGSTTHDHTYTHRHGVAAHNHTEVSNTSSTVSLGRGVGAGGAGASGIDHTHAITIANSTGGETVDSAIDVSSTAHSPAYTDVIFIQQLTEAKSSTDTYTAAMTETESMVVVTTSTDTYTAAMSETESLFFLTATLDAPTEGEVVTTATITVEWTLTGGTQYSYRVRVFSNSACNEASEVYDTETVVDPTASHDIPPLTLENDTTYWVRATLTDTEGNVVRTECVEFTTDFSPSVNVENLALEQVGHCTEGDVLPGIWLRWSAVSPSVDETFVEYDVYKRESGSATWTRIAAITDRLTVQFRDYDIISDAWYEYAVVWQADTASGILISDFQSPPPKQRVTYDWNFLHERDNPSYWAPLNAYDVNISSTPEIQYRRAWGRRKPTAFIGEGWAESIEISGLEKLRRNKTLWTRFRNLVSRQYTAGSVLVLRSGIDRTLHYVQLSAVSRNAANELQFTTSLSLQEVHFDEEV